MTGSGKTGLALGLLEEALIDNVPVIAIDPKGDLPNLLLTFPNLAAEDFLPWVDAQEAARAGMDAQQFAASQAERWRKGLAEWDQAPERIARLRAAAEFAVYTPGSRAGLPVNVLGSFEPPAPAVREDRDLLRERVQGTATSLLSLAGVEADAAGREHALVANILYTAWSGGKGLDFPGLIRAIQEPPFTRVGVMDLDSFFPAKERFQLAMRFNAILAAPGFEAWLEGEPLDIGRLLFTPQGRPRASIFSISHLGDAERMFFVSKLLNEVLAWVRTQPGTSSLRALLYMDEIFGYFPPVSNPPSKQPLLTLLKQARAFGLGVVLSTQNPVDLDYKGLANTGTWFIGRLQTEGDKNRVMAGLEGAAAGSAFDRGRIEKILSGLGKRVFLMNNVHESEPAIFQTRWTLSYLAGPMTRDHIRRLTQAAPGATAPAPAPEAATAPAPAAAASAPPMLAPGISAWYLQPPNPAAGGSSTTPTSWAASRSVTPTPGWRSTRRGAWRWPPPCPTARSPWTGTRASPCRFDRAQLAPTPPPAAAFAELPAAAGKPKSYDAWRKELVRWVRQNCPLVILRSERFKLASRPEESRAEFLGRLAQLAREQRDAEVEKLRRGYAEKFTQLKDRLMRAEQAVAREQEQLSAKKVETAISFGTAILGAFLGRKAVSASSAGRLGTAMKSAGRLKKESADRERAQETVAALEAKLAELDQALQADIGRLEAAFDPSAESLQEVSVAPTATGIASEFFGLVWLPYRRDESGQGRRRPGRVEAASR